MLVGSRYIQASDPGAVGFGYQWANSSTGVIYERNAANTAWMPAGDVTRSTMGFLPVAGGAVTATFTGAHGIVQTDGSVPFTNTPNVNGTMVCLMSDIEAAVKAIKLQLPSLVYSATSSLATSSINGNIIHWYDDSVGQVGVVASPEIPIPMKVAKYYDGTSVKSSDMVAIGRYNNLSVPGGMAVMKCGTYIPESGSTYVVGCWCISGTAALRSGSFGYMAIAVNSNS